MKKYCIEFGIRGGFHTENYTVTGRENAERLARLLVATFTNDPHAIGATGRDWLFDKHAKRLCWKNNTHFISVSLLDGVARGPASAFLWKKPEGEELLSGTVSAYYS